MERRSGSVSRRNFVKYTAMLAVGGRAFLNSGDARGAIYAARDAGGTPGVWPEMTYRTLGRTGFNASRLVMGCGATLMFRQKDALLSRSPGASNLISTRFPASARRPILPPVCRAALPVAFPMTPR